MIHSTHSKEKENAKSQKKVFYPFFPFTQGLLTYFSFLERCSLSQSDRLAYPSSKNVRGCGGEVYALCMYVMCTCPGEEEAQRFLLFSSYFQINQLLLSLLLLLW